MQRRVPGRMRRGITLTEVMVGVLILGLTVLTATAVFPLSALLRDRSGSYSRAAAIVQRKVEQVRRLDATLLNYTGLRTAGVIDEETTPPTGPNAEFRFTTTDSLARELLNGTGFLRLRGMGTDLVGVEVEVRWTGLRGRAESVAAATAVADKRVWKEP